MKGLSAKHDLGIDFYDSIAQNKEDDEVKKRLILLRTFVSERYGEYERNSRNLHTMAKINNILDKDLDDLKKCYSTRGKIGKVIKEIKEMQGPMQMICPYCALNHPNTMDHYLPRSEFPEFSILGINLIPCCSDCNGKKNDIWRVNNRRVFINFYFDNIDDMKFLYTIVDFVQPNPNLPSLSFRLIRPEEMSKEQFEIIESHFLRLRLFELYEKRVSDEVDTIFERVKKTSSEITVSQQKTSLNAELDTLKYKYGVNYWKVSLYDGILASEEFFGKCYPVQPV